MLQQTSTVIYRSLYFYFPCHYCVGTVWDTLWAGVYVSLWPKKIFYFIKLVLSPRLVFGLVSWLSSAVLATPAHQGEGDDGECGVWDCQTETEYSHPGVLYIYANVIKTFSIIWAKNIYHFGPRNLFPADRIY